MIRPGLPGISGARYRFTDKRRYIIGDQVEWKMTFEESGCGVVGKQREK